MLIGNSFALVIYGIFKGRYDFRVINYEIEFDDLPVEFDGYQLTHISDIHAGSLSNKEFCDLKAQIIVLPTRDPLPTSSTPTTYSLIKSRY